MGRAAVVVPNMAARLVAVEDSLEMVAQEAQGIPLPLPASPLPASPLASSARAQRIGARPARPSIGAEDRLHDGALIHEFRKARSAVRAHPFPRPARLGGVVGVRRLGRCPSAAASRCFPMATEFLRFPKSICTFHGVTFTVDPRYVIRSHVGQGAQGVIWSAIDTHSADQKEVAVKKVPNALVEVLASKRLLRELRVLRHLKHDNIIALTDIMLPPSTNVLLWKDVYMVYELMDTDLDYVIKSGRSYRRPRAHFSSQQREYHICTSATSCTTISNQGTFSSTELSAEDLRFRTRAQLLKQSDTDSSVAHHVRDNALVPLARAVVLQLNLRRHGRHVVCRMYHCRLFTRKPLFREQISQPAGTGRQGRGHPSEEDRSRDERRGAPVHRGAAPGEATIDETLANASPLAKDLVCKLLMFNAEKRLTPRRPTARASFLLL